MKPASQVSGMELNCADQKGRMQSEDCYEGCPRRDTTCFNQKTAMEKQGRLGERGDRWDLGDQGHWQGGGVRSMGTNTGF